MMRTITLEEHFISPTLEGSSSSGPRRSAELIDRLRDVGVSRIAAMDRAGIDVQVLSLNTPGVEQLEANEAVTRAREANDYLAEVVQRHPDRFAGFAALPTATPDIAAEELERTVRQYGFKGALLNGHTRGRYLDEAFFWPIFERAAALNVPIYLHPTPPPQPVLDTYFAGFSPEVTALLASPAWGWHIETAVHALRLILGGVFDRYPTLQLLLGHLGEGLPFMLPRIDGKLPTEITRLERPMASYLCENVHYTISGFNWMPAFLDLLLQVGVDRILFSADYPYASMEEARAFLAQMPLSSADREKVAHGNAERLLNL